jgi:hypothetical protein
MTEEDKERIRAEEIFREEVRRDITSRERRSRWQVLIGFLSTFFGITDCLTLVEVIAIDDQIERYGGSAGVRDLGLVGGCPFSLPNGLLCRPD